MEGGVDRLLAHFRNGSHAEVLTDFAPVLDRVGQALASDPQPSYGKFLMLSMELYAEWRRASVCGEKTPQNVRYLNEIAQMLPRSRFVHIVRDPRAVVASALKVGWTAPDALINTLKWKIDLLYASDFEGSPASHSVLFHTLRYEDLVQAPEATLRRMCEAINLPFDDGMLSFHATAIRRITSEPWKSGTAGPLSRQALDRWRGELMPSQVALIQLFAGRLMRRLGYAPDPCGAGNSFACRLRSLHEVQRYIAYKSTERRTRARAGSSNLSHSDARPLRRMLFRALFTA